MWRNSGNLVITHSLSNLYRDEPTFATSLENTILKAMEDMHAPDLTENCQITGVIWGVISGLIVHA